MIAGTGNEKNTSSVGQKIRRIGVFGGTFSPPHLGHVHAAEAFLCAVKPDRLLVIPDALPPHKELDGGATAEDRFAMAKLAFSGLPDTEVSDMELRRGGVSYTSDTLSALASGDTKLYLLCGTDMFLTFDAWHLPQVIFDLATVCCVRREQNEDEREIQEKKREYERKYGAEMLLIDAPVFEISSSELRGKLQSGEDVSALLPAGVEQYIRNKGLYT